MYIHIMYIYNMCMYIYIYIYVYVYVYIYIYMLPRGGPERAGDNDTGRAAGIVHYLYTRSPLQDSRLFGPRPWKVLATTYKENDF